MFFCVSFIYIFSVFLSEKENTFWVYAPCFLLGITPVYIYNFFFQNHEHEIFKLQELKVGEKTAPTWVRDEIEWEMNISTRGLWRPHRSFQIKSSFISPTWGRWGGLLQADGPVTGGLLLRRCPVCCDSAGLLMDRVESWLYSSRCCLFVSTSGWWAKSDCIQSRPWCIHSARSFTPRVRACGRIGEDVTCPRCYINFLFSSRVCM